MSDSESSDAMHVSSTTDARGEGDALETGYKSGDQFTRSFAELDSLRGLEKLCDVVLVAGSERIPAHRVILASLSPYFRAMFTGEMAESRKKEIVINGVEPSALVSLVDYAYTAFVKLSESNVQSLLAAASALQFDEVRDAASQFLMRHLDAENCLGIKRFAEAHGCKQLHSAAEVYAAHWFSDVCKREEYLSLQLSDVVPFLSNHRLNVESEYVVFKAALSWLDHNRTERTGHLYEVMRCVRFSLLTEDQLLKEVGRNSSFIGNPQCVELMVEALQHRLLPDTKNQVDSKHLVPRKPSELLYAVGGWDGHTAVSTVEYYDTDTEQWTLGTPLLSKRNGVGLAFTGGLLYAVGGHDGHSFLNTAEVFNPQTSRWQSIPPLKQKRASAGVAVLGNYLYAVGGQEGVARLKSVERYNLLGKSWELAASMSVRRDSPGVVVHEDQIYAIGGCHSCMFLNTVERYDPVQNSWSSARHMIHRRSAVGVVSCGTYIYVLGGHNEQRNLTVLERYDLKKDCWTELSFMNVPRAGVGAAILNRKIVAVGGFNGSEQLASVEQYDPVTDSWSYLPPMKNERSYVGAMATVKIT
jgi:N-acetylneuraminic acid mutarotase